MKTTLLAIALAAAMATPVAADRADDDLAAVKKAVHSEQKPPASAERRPAEAAPLTDEDRGRPAPRHAEGPRWFHVKVVGKGAKQGRVSISLPLGLVRAIGEDWPIQGCHRCEHGHGPTIGDVLRSLDSGQNLVEIDDPEATVRVWVE